MIDIATTLASYCWIFGALAVWPTLKFLVGVPSDRLCVLKWLFWLQVFWLLVSFLVVYYYRTAAHPNWLDSLLFPYLVGTISWLTVITALLALIYQSKRKVSRSTR
jgi:hypothetical protein